MIANPNRLLPPHMARVTHEPSCYVIGCYGIAVVGINHPRFGKVVACDGHNPLKYDIGKPFGRPAAPASLPAWSMEDDEFRGPGGKPEPRVPFMPRPPTPSTAARPF